MHFLKNSRSKIRCTLYTIRLAAFFGQALVIKDVVVTQENSTSIKSADSTFARIEDQFFEIFENHEAEKWNLDGSSINIQNIIKIRKTLCDRVFNEITGDTITKYTEKNDHNQLNGDEINTLNVKLREAIFINSSTEQILTLSQKEMSYASEFILCCIKKIEDKKL